MELVVDLAKASVVLRDRNDLERFSVLALPRQLGDSEQNGALGALAAALSLHNVGTVGPDGVVLVPADGLRRLAGDAATRERLPLDPAWELGFGAMIDAAEAKGWVAEDGSIRAHVEWAD